MSGQSSHALDARLSRRRAIAAVAASATGLLAGCQGLPFSEQPVETGHLFVQNREDEPIELSLSLVEDAGDGERVVHATYRVPADTALQFEGVLEAGTEYAVRAVQPNLQEQGETNLDIVAETCEEDDPAGSVDVAVNVSSSGPEISVFNCQTPYTRTGELTYQAAAEYRIGTPEGTVGSPTSS